MTDRSSPSALPSAPVDLVGVAICGCQVIMAWTECGGGGAGLGFRIERADFHSPCKKFVEIGEAGENVAAFRDGSVEPGTTHSYRVLAWNASGDSSPSNEVEMTTPKADTELPADKE